MSKAKKLKQKIHSFFYDTLRFSASAVGAPRIEIIEQEKMTVFQCSTIDKYSEREIILITPNGKISIIGTRLSLTTFVDQTVEITGVLHSLQFYPEEESHPCI